MTSPNDPKPSQMNSARKMGSTCIFSDHQWTFFDFSKIFTQPKLYILKKSSDFLDTKLSIKKDNNVDIIEIMLIYLLKKSKVIY